MANNQLKRLLEFANMQMAAEAFLVQLGQGIDGQVPSDDIIAARLVQGNRHASRFTPVQATQFLSEYEVLAQYRNDPTLAGQSGFSGTLFLS